MMRRRYSNNTLLKMTKAEIIELLRCAEHNLSTAEEQLRQQIENVKGWRPVVCCKDCEHGVEVTDCGRRYLCCSIYGKTMSQMRPDDFCSFGERKKESIVE